jgi:hypothetical protein
VTALDEIHDAWDKATGDGRDEDQTRALADAYVAEHPDEFANLRDLSQEDLVKAIDVFRAAGFETDVQRIQTWLWHRFEPQAIGGPLRQTIRFPGV